jgi:hypothetical protein
MFFNLSPKGAKKAFPVEQQVQAEREPQLRLFDPISEARNVAT